MKWDLYLNDKNLSKIDHWIYGFCNNETDTEGISHLIKYNFFENSACIKKYFNSKEQRYYDTGDSKFRWPIISHGTYLSNNVFYTLIIEKCEEETINLILGGRSYCRSEEEIEELMQFSTAAHLYYVDNYINILNYKNPNVKFFNVLESSIGYNSYPMNHLNINPTSIKTNDGLIWDHNYENFSYIFERNDVFTYTDEEHKIF